MLRCKGRPEPNSSSDEEEEETDEEEEEEEEESDEEDLESSGDESTWTWSGCSSRTRLLKLQHSHCKCNNCESFPPSHFETRHRVGHLGAAGGKDCATSSCRGDPAAGDDGPSHFPIGASGIFDTTFGNKLH